MWIVLTVLLTVSSENARSFLEETFAAGSAVVADHLWLCLGATVLLALSMVLAVSAYQVGKVRTSLVAHIDGVGRSGAGTAPLTIPRSCVVGCVVFAASRRCSPGGCPAPPSVRQLPAFCQEPVGLCLPLLQEGRHAGVSGILIALHSLPCL